MTGTPEPTGQNPDRTAGVPISPVPTIPPTQTAVPLSMPPMPSSGVSWPQVAYMVAYMVVAACLSIGLGLLNQRTNTNTDRISNVVAITREQLDDARKRREENEAQIHKNEATIEELEARVKALEQEKGKPSSP